MEDTIEILNPYGFIYLTTNMINGKKYIGQRKFYGSWKEYLGSGNCLVNALKKYGEENFSREIIAIACSKEELNELEIEFINLHNAVESDDYYNIASGGGILMAGLHHSDEVKKKLSDANKGKHPSEETLKKMSISHKGEKGYNYGKTLSKETKIKIGKASTGRIHSDETKRKISDQLKGNKYMLGKHHSEKTKQKMRLNNKGENNPYFGKKHSDETKQKMRKVNDSQVIEIREKYTSGQYTQIELAEIYKVSLITIGRIINFKGTYKKININKEE